MVLELNLVPGQNCANTQITSWRSIFVQICVIQALHESLYRVETGNYDYRYVFAFTTSRTIFPFQDIDLLTLIEEIQSTLLHMDAKGTDPCECFMEVYYKGSLSLCLVKSL